MEPDNIILEHLRAIRATLETHTRKFDDLIGRTQAVETGLTEVRREVVHLGGRVDALAVRVDGIDKRLERVENLLGHVNVNT